MSTTPTPDQQQRLAMLNHALTVGAQPQRELPCSGDRDLTIMTCVACIHRGRAFARFAWGISFGGSDGVVDQQMGQPVSLIFAQNECSAAFIVSGTSRCDATFPPPSWHQLTRFDLLASLIRTRSLHRQSTTPSPSPQPGTTYTSSSSAMKSPGSS